MATPGRPDRSAPRVRQKATGARARAEVEVETQEVGSDPVATYQASHQPHLNVRGLRDRQWSVVKHL